MITDHPRHRQSWRAYRRSSSDRYLAGVAGGWARTLGVDSMFVRIALVVAAVIAPATVLVYVAMWLLAPADDEERSLLRSYRDPSARRMILAAVALGIGTLVLAPDLGRGGHAGLQFGVLLICGGIALLARREGGAPAPAVAPAAAEAAELPAARRTLRLPRAATRAPRPRPFLAPVALSVVALIVGIAAALDQSSHSVSPGGVVSLCLIAVGGALVISAWRGRARSLVLVGLALVPLWIGLSLADIPRYPGTGDRAYRPVSTAGVEDEYALGFGQLRVDLTAVPLERGGDLDVHVGMTAGRTIVYVPAAAYLRVVGHTGLADMEIWDDGEQFGYPSRIDDTGVRADAHVDRSYRPLVPYCELTEYFPDKSRSTATQYLDRNGMPCAPGAPIVNPARVTLRVTVGLGLLEVHRVPTSN